MKNRMRSCLFTLLSACFLLSCAACGYAPAADAAGDYPYWLNENNNFHNIAETEAGFYIAVPGRVFFVDKASMTPVPLCAKPDCPHTPDSDACGANLTGGVFGAQLCAMGDSLYAVHLRPRSTQYVLSRLSPDGTVRRELLAFDNAVSQFVLHRGRLYAATQYYDETGAPVEELLEYDMTRLSAPPKRLYAAKKSETGGRFGSLLAYGDSLYFLDCTEDNSPQLCAYRLYLPTGEVSRLPGQEDGASTVFLTVFDGRIVITRYRPDDTDGLSFPDSPLISYAPDGSDRTSPGVFPHSVTASDADFFYQRDSARGNPAIRDKAFRVYGHDYRPVAQLSMENLPGIDGLPSFTLLYPTASDYVLLYAASVRDARHFFYYFRKSEAAAGQARIVPLLSFEDGEFS
ncbi:MAG: hypothetical protein ACI4QB_07575 [Eubacteriales bacterium]